MQKLDPTNYERKFAGFIAMCETQKREGVDTVLIAHPTVLGDNYAEIVESLTRLANAELRLLIVPQQKTK